MYSAMSSEAKPKETGASLLTDKGLSLLAAALPSGAFLNQFSVCLAALSQSFDNLYLLKKYLVVGEFINISL